MKMANPNFSLRNNSLLMLLRLQVTTRELSKSLRFRRKSNNRLNVKVNKEKVSRYRNSSKLRRSRWCFMKLSELFI